MGASASAVRAGQAFVELTTKNAGLNAGLNQASARLRAFGNSVGAIGRQLVGLGAAMALPLGMGLQQFVAFDDKMREVQAVTGGTAADLQMLTERARHLGAVTSFTAVQVGALMAELGRAGFRPNEINEMTQAVLNLSRATTTDSTIASGIMAATLRQFGLGASQAARASDALTVAANSSFNTVTTLGESLQYAGPVAASFNMSLEDTLAILGSLGNAGIQGSNAGTALRRMLILTGSEAENLNRIFGVTATDASGNMRPLVDVMDEIAAATRGLGTAQRAARFNEFFGLLGITGATVLGNSVTSTRELRTALLNAGGAAQRAADQMDAGLGGAIRILTSSVEGAVISFGNALAPSLVTTGKLLTDLVNSMIAWINVNQNSAIAILAGVVSVIGLGVALITLGVAFKIAAIGLSVFTTLWSVLAGTLMVIKGLMLAILSPVGLLIAGLGGLVYVWGTFTTQGQSAFSTLRSGFASLATTASTTWGGIMDAMAVGDLQGAFDIALLGLNVAWTQVAATLRQTWAEFAGWFVDTWAHAVGRIADLFGMTLQDWRAVLAEIRGTNEASIGAAAPLEQESAQLAAQIAAARRARAQALGISYQELVRTGQDDAATQELIRQRDALQQRISGILGNAQLPSAGTRPSDIAREEQAQRERDRAAAAAADEATISALQERLQGVRDFAAAERETAAIVQGIADFVEAEASTERIVADMERAAQRADPALGLSQAAAKADVKGTFSAFAVGGLGASSVTDRIARATERTADGVENMARPAFT